MTILVCGEALYDVFFETERPDGFGLDARIGGSALNVAIGLGRLGEGVGLLTGVSEDKLGDRLVATLAAEGVDTSYLRRKTAPTTLAMVSLDDTGSAQYLFYNQNAADQLITTDDLPDFAPLKAAVFGCFSIVTKPTGDSFLTFAERICEAGKLVVLDPNIRPSIAPDLKIWRERVGAFAAQAGLVKASSEDLAHLYPGASIAAVAQEWLDLGAAAVAITKGEKGAIMVRRSGTVAVPARSVKVVDTVGAGDSFLAACLARLAAKGATSRAGLDALTDAEVEATLAYAVSAAAITCARRGADLPKRDDVVSAPG